MYRAKKDKTNHVSEYRFDEPDSDEFFFGVLKDKPLTQRWMKRVVTNKVQVNMKQDTGAHGNVLPYNLYCKLMREKMERSNSRLVSYTGQKMHVPVMGKAKNEINREVPSCRISNSLSIQPHQ